MKKILPNLLVLGASGNVARAFLRRLAGQRGRFGSVTLVDMNRRLLCDPYIDLRFLNATFLQWRLDLERERGAYQTFLKKRKINIVLDVTTHDTLPSLAAANQAGVSFLNTSLADHKAKVDELVAATYDRPRDYVRAPHILCAGMNPGAVNFWVAHGIAEHGKPTEAIHFEYDTSMTPGGWKPVLTWSPHEFIEEVIRAPAGFAHGRQVNKIYPNPLMVREPLRAIMEPVWKLNKYPEGFLVLHEENLILARHYGIKTRFVYAIHQKTMDYMTRLYKKNGMLKESDFLVGDNVAHRLIGEDTIGVLLDYPDRRVYYLNSIQNSSITGANATCAQVAIGIYAALLTLTIDRIRPGLHFAGGLRGTTYEDLLLQNMRVEEYVFKKQGGRLKLASHTPAIQGRESKRAHRVLF